MGLPVEARARLYQREWAFICSQRQSASR